MRKITATLTVLLVLSLTSYGQSSADKPYYLKVSAGRVLFGEGDIPGASVMIEGGKNLVKKPRTLLNQLLVGVEISTDVGATGPKVNNPTFEEFASDIFYHRTDLALTAKVSYYPLRRLLPGLNIAAGPTVVYSYSSSEAKAELRSYSPEMNVRMSQLRFNNSLLVGYRISTGYEWTISRKLLAGVRADLVNYSNGDFNTLGALKLGIRW